MKGTRRLWGTYWSYSSIAVNSAITKLCGMTVKSVKRKSIVDSAGKTIRWWFIISLANSSPSERADWDDC